MKSHYIPQLLLRQFSDDGRTWYWSEKTQTVEQRNIKSLFQKQNLYPEDLEIGLATKIEGQFGDLLNNKLLAKRNHIVLTYEELIRNYFYKSAYLKKERCQHAG